MSGKTEEDKVRDRLIMSTHSCHQTILFPERLLTAQWPLGGRRGLATERDRGWRHLWVHLGPGTFFQGPILSEDRKENKLISARGKLRQEQALSCSKKAHYGWLWQEPRIPNP